MEDFVKGIIVGIIAVKLIQSDLVQNYICKKTKQLAEEAGKSFVDGVFPTRKEKVCERDENGKPISGRYPYGSDSKSYKIVKDSNGNSYVVNERNLHSMED